MTKLAIILQAGPGSDEGMARALHSLVYSKELVQNGHDLRLVFDGAGTEWVARWLDPVEEGDRGLAALFSQLMDNDLVYVVCDFCSTFFHVRDRLAAHDAPIVSQFMNHTSIASLVNEGYQLLAL